METLKDYSRQIEQIGVDNLSTKESQSLEQIERGIMITRNATGLIVSDAKINDLEIYVAGKYKNSEIYIDTNLIESGDEKIAHVILHEAWHKKNDQSSNVGILNPNGVKLHEGLTELATKESTSETIAYQEEVAEVKNIASKTGESIGNIVSLYKEGRNEEINRIIKSVYPDNYEQQIAA